MRTPILLTILLLFAVPAAAADMQWIKVSDDSTGFVLAESGKPFTPCGVNYDHDSAGKLPEDYWDDQRPTVESDFQEMTSLGANVFRIHLQCGRFMESPTKPRQSSLDQLARLVQLAEQTGSYLDVNAASFLNNGVTGHRGNSGEYPENTIPALESGIELGADWIELDLFRTKDGKLVVIHDRTTQRVGDKSLDVPHSTYEELLTVDVATDFRRRTGKSIKECPPQQIPLLEDVLRLVMQQDRTRVSIQPKMDCVADAVALVKNLQAQRWVGFNDGNLQYMAEVKRLGPEIPVFWDRGADTDIDNDIQTSKQHGFEALVLHHSGVTAEKVQKIKSAGLEAGAWTVNDRPTMEALLDRGIERIYTDQPRMLLSVKKGQ